MRAGALTYVDGVHATPHGPTDMRRARRGLLRLSTYKWFGPHAGAVVADAALLATLEPAQARAVVPPGAGRFERGTSAFELLSGITAAVDWLAGLTDALAPRRDRLVAALTAVEEYLAGLLRRALDGLATIDGVRVLGSARRRTSTLSLVVNGHEPRAVAEHLARRRVAVWDGDNYAHELMGRFGLQEAGGAVRASLVLYNTAVDVDRLLEALAELSEQRRVMERSPRSRAGGAARVGRRRGAARAGRPGRRRLACPTARAPSCPRG